MVVASVLVVDDDSAFLALAAQVLEEIGVGVVLRASDAAEAVAVAAAERPAAALVDVGLPDREGIDLARQLAASPWKPRVVLTSTDRDAGRALAGGLDGTIAFIPKEELAGCSLRRLLDAE